MNDTTSPPNTSHAGKVLLGKYQLVQRLGRGGMGEVYQAENLLIGRQVAIKLLLPQHLSNRQLVARFLREARAANIVRHPNVVDVQDIGEDAELGPFIVQELLEGEDLGRRLERDGPLSIGELRELILPILDALSHAHARQVVHRDLKPENVFLMRANGRIVPKLLDFGVSQIALSPGEKRLTVTDAIIGSPAYMAPEQIAGGQADARVDVWAIGVILYEALSNRLPFDAPTTGAMFMRIATEDPDSLADTMPSVPAEIVRIVERCLQRDRSKRYRNAGEVRDDLAAFLAHQGDAGECGDLAKVDLPGQGGSSFDTFDGGLEIPRLEPRPRGEVRRVSSPDPKVDADPFAEDAILDDDLSPSAPPGALDLDFRRGESPNASADPFYQRAAIGRVHGAQSPRAVPGRYGSADLGRAGPGAVGGLGPIGARRFTATGIEQVVASGAGRRGPLDGSVPESEDRRRESREFVLTIAAALLALGLSGGAHFVLLPGLSGMVVSGWQSRVVSGTADLSSLGFAAAVIIVALFAVPSGLRLPRSTGRVILGAGCGVLGAAILGQARGVAWGMSQVVCSELTLLKPWSVACIGAGAAISGFAKAWRQWKGREGAGRVAAIALAVASLILIELSIVAALGLT